MDRHGATIIESWSVIVPSVRLAPIGARLTTNGAWLIACSRHLTEMEIGDSVQAFALPSRND